MKMRSGLTVSLIVCLALALATEAMGQKAPQTQNVNVVNTPNVNVVNTPNVTATISNAPSQPVPVTAPSPLNVNVVGQTFTLYDSGVVSGTLDLELDTTGCSSLFACVFNFADLPPYGVPLIIRVLQLLFLLPAS